MTDLQSLTATGNSTAIEGMTLSPPRLIDWAEAEAEAAQSYLRNIARGCAELPPQTRQQIHARAVDNLQSAPFAFGGQPFDAWALSAAACPTLLYLSLRSHHPQIARNKAADLLNGPDGQTIAQAIWDLWGYPSEKKAEAAPPARGPSNGETSSPD
ncbi:MAG: hypothetical protein M3O30_17020 [Planctomycetota bacterium]|nr:hypothetical protein [Planctomycetota bacterium]